MSNEIIQKQIEAYRINFLEHGDSPRGTFQNNVETQFLRFSRLIRNLPFEKKERITIHDVGAGVCDLHKYLLIHKIDHEYSGTEIVQEMVELASAKYPEILLLNRDLLAVDDKEVYDFVVLSGVFNLPGQISTEEWKKFCYRIIKKMFDLSKRAISFNFLTTEGTFTDPSLCYFDPSEMLKFCHHELSRFVLLDQSYPLYEVTVTVVKKPFMKLVYKDDFFDKYFKN